MVCRVCHVSRFVMDETVLVTYSIVDVKQFSEFLKSHGSITTSIYTNKKWLNTGGLAKIENSVVNVNTFKTPT